VLGSTVNHTESYLSPSTVIFQNLACFRSTRPAIPRGRGPQLTQFGVWGFLPYLCVHGIGVVIYVRGGACFSGQTTPLHVGQIRRTDCQKWLSFLVCHSRPSVCPMPLLCLNEYTISSHFLTA